MKSIKCRAVLLCLLIALGLGVVLALAADRSHKWESVRREHLRLCPDCLVCGTTNDIEVHHVNLFSTHPHLELEPTNLVTLCRKHHHEVGHPAGWDKGNSNFWQDVNARQTEPITVCSNKLVKVTDVCSTPAMTVSNVWIVPLGNSCLPAGAWISLLYVKDEDAARLKAQGIGMTGVVVRLYREDQ